MRKLILMLLFVSATLLLVACGDDEEQVTDPLPGDSNQSEEVTDDGAANDATDDATRNAADDARGDAKSSFTTDDDAKSAVCPNDAKHANHGSKHDTRDGKQFVFRQHSRIG